jgi:sarcosine oxidase
VTAIRAEGGRATGVETSSGSINAETVVVAAGAWSSRLLRPLGLSLPQRAIRSTVMATTPVPPVTRLVVWAEGVAFRQDHRGRFILAGGGRNEFEIDLETIRHGRQFWGSLMDARRRGHLRLRAGGRLAHDVQSLVPGTRARRDPWSATQAEPRPSLAAAWATLQNFRRTMPALADAGMQEVWAGNIDYTPDAVPVIEAITNPSGVVIATGFSGHGFALGPIGGRLAAQLAAGEQPSLDLDPFRLARFAEGRTHEKELHF